MEQFETETPEIMMIQASVNAQAQREWEADPTVWQRLDERTPYGDDSVDRMGQYEDPAILEEFPTVADAVMELPHFQDGGELFRRHLRAMVLSRHAQMAPGRVEPVDRAEFEALPARTQLAGAERLEAMVDEVFSWMRSQGMDPWPGRQAPPRLVNEELRRRMLAKEV